eukprot:NODE_105_length_2786_cov_146.151991_g81_i0.p1 GENE.NODE_105_length_2786_cov_146.151991_g81_i0~~NODE_105_length_2786_cov_146.151991_g81_i0.p1  ORF type:complete len:867 (-),score=328.01 NODE_105_length_2786_cov_146.151991_g81_i0:186-2678(-)
MGDKKDRGAFGSRDKRLSPNTQQNQQDTGFTARPQDKKKMGGNMPAPAPEKQGSISERFGALRGAVAPAQPPAPRPVNDGGPPPQQSRSPADSKPAVQVELHKVENRYQAKAKQVEKDDVASTANVIKVTMGVLNKLTPEKYSELVEELLKPEWFRSSEPAALAAQDTAAKLILERALEQREFSGVFARLCKAIHDYQVHYLIQKKQAAASTPTSPSDAEGGTSPTEGANFPDPDKLKGTLDFKRALVSKCEAKYSSLQAAAKAEEDKHRGTDGGADEKRKIRQSMLNHIKFVGDLYIHKLLACKVILSLLGSLLFGDGQGRHVTIPAPKGAKGRDKSQEKIYLPPEDEVLLLCILWETIGRELEGSGEKDASVRATLDSHFARMHILSTCTDYDFRIRCKVMLVLDLRKANWVPRIASVGPTTIQEHTRQLEAKKEAKMQQLRDPTAPKKPIAAPPPQVSPWSKGAFANVSMQLSLSAEIVTQEIGCLIQSYHDANAKASSAPQALPKGCNDSLRALHKTSKNPVAIDVELVSKILEDLYKSPQDRIHQRLARMLIDLNPFWVAVVLPHTPQTSSEPLEGASLTPEALTKIAEHKIWTQASVDPTPEQMAAQEAVEKILLDAGISGDQLIRTIGDKAVSFGLARTMFNLIVEDARTDCPRAFQRMVLALDAVFPIFHLFKLVSEIFAELLIALLTDAGEAAEIAHEHISEYIDLWYYAMAKGFHPNVLEKMGYTDFDAIQRKIIKRGILSIGRTVQDKCPTQTDLITRTLSLMAALSAQGNIIPPKVWNEWRRTQEAAKEPFLEKFLRPFFDQLDMNDFSAAPLPPSTK